MVPLGDTQKYSAHYPIRGFLFLSFYDPAIPLIGIYPKEYKLIKKGSVILYL